ncbi:DNA replication checkpoint protein tel2 [Ophiocordyceps camponoti-floridani]|uniref:DNA replication checkpoint protein tel2 n=1 Tax=Ophiocordyceps camponoti-floridani TaxID=2030778 RepID=A0A8H4VDS9_9HYPO|nr:DNA replication checkpoint protein tel2 [Ophiocordyceps camponoti-floridani]
MDQELRPVSTTYLRTRHAQHLSPSDLRPYKKAKEGLSAAGVSSPDDALEVLKSQPDYDDLVVVLRYLAKEEAQLRLPTPTSASITHALISEIVPNYWAILRENSGGDESEHLQLLLASLRSVTGLNAIITQCKVLIQEANLFSKEARRPEISLNLRLLLDLLASLLEGHGSIRLLWEAAVTNRVDATTGKGLSQQLAALLSNGRILSTAAEASAMVGREALGCWLADGIDYSVWIGRNLSSWAGAQMSDDEVSFAFDVFQRSMSLGYSGSLVNIMVDELLLSPSRKPCAFRRICFHRPHLTKKLMDLLLKHLSQRFLSSPDPADATVAAVAGVIDSVVADDDVRRAHLFNWCTASSGAGLGDAIGIRRCVVAVLAKNKETISTVLEKSLSQFGDELYIKHAAILQQEVHAQVLLLSAGCVARLSPIKLAILLKTGTYLSAISNRIAATQARARFLGMVVGESLSALSEGKAKKLDFHMEEMETEEADWLKGLCRTEDDVGSFDSLTSSAPSIPSTLLVPSTASTTMPYRQATSRRKPKQPPPTTDTPPPKALIEEINSSGDEDDLAPYPKGSDPEDSDDDATLVQRNKPRPPVYVRDLVAYLRDTEDYDKQKLALHSAADLISRKANHGSEVSAHADELAGLLVGLQDKFELDDFIQRKQKAMIALIVAQPKAMAPWFARTFFDGDFSLSQRTAILVALGMAARELAGQQTPPSKFPSKRLPERIEQLFLDPSSRQQSTSSQLKALPQNALGAITNSLTSSFLGPLTAQAADDKTGPNALKLETCTQRYKSSTQKIRPRLRPIPNTTASLLATTFFAPLTAHFQLSLRTAKAFIINPGLLSLYLQTLAIVVHAAGPSTLALPQLTAELCHLLLRVRPHVLGDVDATRGWLVALTVVIDVNEGDTRVLCEGLGGVARVEGDAFYCLSAYER